MANGAFWPPHNSKGFQCRIKLFVNDDPQGLKMVLTTFEVDWMKTVGAICSNTTHVTCRRGHKLHEKSKMADFLLGLQYDAL